MFRYIAVTYPFAISYLISFASDIHIVTFRNMKFIVHADQETQLVTLAFTLLTIANNCYALSQDNKKEILIGAIYYIASIYCLLSNDFISMFLSLEIMMISSTMLIFITRTKKAIRACRLYFLAHIVSSILILISMIYIITKTNNNELFSLSIYITNSIDRASIIYIAMLIGCLINVAAIPFFSWIIYCYPHASNSAFIYLISFTTKVSIILLMKLFQGLILLKFIGAATLLSGALLASREKTLRKILCYLTISQLGFILMQMSESSTKTTMAINQYIAVHILSNGLLSLALVILTKANHNMKCSEISKFQNPLLKICFLFSIATIINMPFTASSIAKSLLSNHVDSFSGYVSLLANILIFMSFPWREYFVNRNNNIIHIKLHQLEIISLSLMTISLMIANILIFDQIYYQVSWNWFLSTFVGLIGIMTIKQRNPIALCAKFNKWNIKTLYEAKKYLLTPLRSAISFLNSLSENCSYSWQKFTIYIATLHNQQTSILLIFTLLIITIIFCNI